MAIFFQFSREFNDFEQKQQKICILTQFSDNSPENLQKKLICLAQ